MCVCSLVSESLQPKLLWNSQFCIATPGFKVYSVLSHVSAQKLLQVL